VNAHTSARAPETRAHGTRRGVLTESGRLRRIWASILVVLVAAPFTSPFPTCDVRALVASAKVTVAHPPPVAPGAIPILSASRETDGAPVSVEEETFQDDVVLTDVVVFTAPVNERPPSTAVSPMLPAFRASLVALRL